MRNCGWCSRVEGDWWVFGRRKHFFFIIIITITSRTVLFLNYKCQTGALSCFSFCLPWLPSCCLETIGMLWNKPPLVMHSTGPFPFTSVCAVCSSTCIECPEQAGTAPKRWKGRSRTRLGRSTVKLCFILPAFSTVALCWPNVSKAGRPRLFYQLTGLSPSPLLCLLEA